MLRRAKGPLTGAALAATVGIARQNVLVHVRHMVECGWLEADGRTPIEPLPAAPDVVQAARRATPLRWASDLSLTCRTCGRLMLILATQARDEWSVQRTMEELATALGRSERITREHVAALTGRRPHAAHPMLGPLLRTERVPESQGRGGLRFVFLGGLTRPGSVAADYSLEEYAELRRTALGVLAQAPLITSGMNADERRSAAELLLIPRLHVGYPPAVLAEGIRRAGDHEGTVTGHAYGLIRWRLDQVAPASGYTPTAQSVQAPERVLHECADCGNPFRALPDVAHCPGCTRRRAAGISLDVALDAEALEYQAMRVPVPRL
ncbi:hypothetical protein ABT160_43600 [Streptomyces sp. NPDC001941]|uniref:hypothetical protein n=1 Tax=Streptomyces sp. NPDC001941 TaxID=3154659 RepID=UPI003326F86B